MLYKYQKEFISKAKKHYIDNNFLLLADEQGLGKTIQAIKVMEELQIYCGIVICPASLKTNWLREINKFSGWFKGFILADVINKGVSYDKFDGQCPIFILNYEQVAKYIKYLNDYEPGFVVLDEAHYLKSPTSKRTKSVLKSEFLKQAKVLALTGTPIPNRPIEIWPLLAHCCPEIIRNMNYYEFGHFYCNGHQTPWGYDVNGSTNIPDLHERLKLVMHRNLKRDVLSQLPSKTYKIIVLNNTKEFKTLIKQEKEFDKNSIELNPDAILNIEGLSTLRRLMGEAKVSKAQEYIKDLLDGGLQKIVVFCHHKIVGELLNEALKKYGSVYLCGSSTLNERQQAIDDFQNKNMNCRAFIGSIKAAGVGITLTAASHVLFVEPSWTPAEIDQAADRCHRIGQPNNVVVEFLVVEGSLDEYILNTILSKKAIIDKIV